MAITNDSGRYGGPVLAQQVRTALTCLCGKCASEFEHVLNTSSVNRMNTYVCYRLEAAASITIDLVNLSIAYRLKAEMI